VKLLIPRAKNYEAVVEAMAVTGEHHRYLSTIFVSAMAVTRFLSLLWPGKQGAKVVAGIAGGVKSRLRQVESGLLLV
jgi:hypothetical protein